MSPAIQAAWERLARDEDADTTERLFARWHEASGLAGAYARLIADRVLRGEDPGGYLALYDEASARETQLRAELDAAQEQALRGVCARLVAV